MGSHLKATSIEQWLRYWKDQKRNHLAVDTAYIYVPWFRTAVNRIANAAQGVPFGVYRGGERVAQEDDYGELGAFEGVDVSLRGLFNGLAANLQMFGRGHYQLREGFFGGQKVELVGAKLIDYRRDANLNITHVEYRRGGYWEVHPIGAGLMDVNEAGQYGMPKVWLISRLRDGEPDSPPGLAALKAAGMVDSMAEFGKNAMDAGGAGPTLVKIENFSTAPPGEKERAQNWFERMWQAANAFKPLVLGNNVEVQRLGWSPEEISFAELSREKREDIAAAFDIPMSILMGNAANYATAQIDLLNFYEFKVIPLWGVIAEQVNPQLSEAFGVELRPEPSRLDVYQEAEARKSRHYLPWVDRGVIGVNEARRFMMMPPRDDVVDDIFFSPAAQSEDLPAPSGSETVDSTVDVDRGGDASDIMKAHQLDDGNTVNGTFTVLKSFDPLAAYVGVPIGNNGAILSFVRRLRRDYPVLADERIEWQLAPTWHITLAYAPMVTDGVLLSAADDVRVDRLRLRSMGLAVFENGEERALHLRIAADEQLGALQRSVYMALNARGVVMSPFSNPNDYQPHVTLAYLPAGLDVSELLARFDGEMVGDAIPDFVSFEADSVQFARDNYEPVVMLNAPGYGTMDNELDAALALWERKAIRRFEEGKPEKALVFEDDALGWGVRNAVIGGLEGAKSVEDVRVVFELAGAGGWEDYP